ncbi:SDR family NAD(P)-dependent oxidoreductase [Streptomyces sp. CB01881]|uniref:SDR family NAD(P)-dependent oxidoreductase n=1 Tax=Streptomyces sp. CB01881 TaxID=2078691 RepID=UPI000CDBDDB8|nr:SDR family NAD(P)-dependent oxidoreductase [Streptomyces sp. CB01881]AUY50271.1 short-chain dehydrogenase [Streptomyces sp. CB01881]TYC73659.1 SDR family oxidoreductase [Streptomyces sp. CB01881]
MRVQYPDLSGKVVVIAGGSRGIGAETARSFARQGAAVAVLGRDGTALAAVEGELRELGAKALGLVADCTDAAALARAATRIEEGLGPVGVLAAFAGGDGYPVPTVRETEEHWRAVLDANLTATFLTVQAFLPGLLERGAGSVVTMASTAGRLPSGSSAAYAAAKAGVLMYTRHLALELAGEGVRVNAIAPGAVRTERTAAVMPPEVQAAVAAAHPLGRLGEPADIAAATLFLASTASSWITGQTLDVSGGRVIV